jgi:hypothetical protein
MRAGRKVFNFLALMICFSINVQAAVLAGRAPSLCVPGGLPFDEEPVLQPSELFRVFPKIEWGMSFEDARKAIEKSGAHPVRAFKDAETELVWIGKFNGMEGRGAVHFKEGAGLDEILVGVYAFDKQKELFAEWLKKLTAKHGPAKEELDNEILVSKVWRLKNGFVIELRLLKDVNSPVVDIH